MKHTILQIWKYTTLRGTLGQHIKLDIQLYIPIFQSTQICKVKQVDPRARCPCYESVSCTSSVVVKWDRERLRVICTVSSPPLNHSRSFLRINQAATWPKYKHITKLHTSSERMVDYKWNQKRHGTIYTSRVVTSRRHVPESTQSLPSRRHRVLG